MKLSRPTLTAAGGPGARTVETPEVRIGPSWQRRSRTPRPFRKVPAGTVIAMHPTVEPELRKGETVIDAIERVRRRGRELQADLNKIRASSWPSTIAKGKCVNRSNNWR